MRFYLKLCKVDSMEQLSTEQLKRYLSLKFENLLSVFEIGTKKDIDTAIKLGKQAIKEGRDIDVGMYYHESAFGPPPKSDRNFFIDIL